MEFKLEKYHRNTSDDELLQNVKDVATKLNNTTITIADYEAHGEFHPTTLTRRFKSWFKVLELTGLEPSRAKINISEIELLDNIKNVWIFLGRQPKYHEIKKPISKYSAGTYENRFGSWGNALQQFVAFVSSDENTESQNDSIKTDESPETYVNSPVKHKTKREISERLRFRILMRDGFTCKKCGRTPIKELGVELHVDHILPWSKGGETVPENLETKCFQCNMGKGNAFDA